VSLPSIIIIY